MWQIGWHVLLTHLHAAVVNDHRLKLDVGIKFSHLLTFSKKQAIWQFPRQKRDHNVMLC